MIHTPHNPDYTVEVAPSREVMAYMVKYHYLHTRILRTKTLGYFIKRAGQVIGGIMFSRPQFQSKVGLFGHPGLPDYWQVLVLARIHLQDGVEVNVSSAMAQITKNGGVRLQEDWCRVNPPRYADKPIVPTLLLSWSDHGYGHDGTVYRSMSWKQWPDTINGKRLWVKTLLPHNRLEWALKSTLTELAPQKSEEKIYFVYEHHRLTGGCFYVGKGTKTRANYGERSQRWHNIVNKDGGYTVNIVKSNLTHTEAITLEIQLIAFYGRNDMGAGPLVNLTDGGEGMFNPSEETRERIAKAHRGKKQSIERVEERASQLRGRVTSEETKKKISAAQRGRPLSEEHRLKLKEAAQKRWASKEERQKQSKRSTGNVPTTESRLKMRNARLGKHLSEEAKQKVSEARTQYWVNRRTTPPPP